MKLSKALLYKPRGPEIKLTKAVLYRKDLNKKRPAEVPPMEAVDKSLESNIYAKILAARPKTDVNTRSILPRSMLTKLGVQDDKFTAVSSHKLVKGQRGYISPKVPLEARHKTPILRKPRYEKTRVSGTYSEDAGKVVEADLQLLMQDYAPEGPVVLCVNHVKKDIPSVQSSFDVPSTITVGKNQSGMRLAAFICCQSYLDQNTV